MKRSSKKLPRDTNQRAAEIVRLSTEEPAPIQTEPVTAYLAAIGRKGGLKGGKVRAERLSDKRRKEIASLGGKALSKSRQNKPLP